MDTRGATVLLVGAVGLLVGATGGAWLASTRRPARSEEPMPVRSAAAAELAPVLADLARTLDALRATLAMAPAPTLEPLSVPPTREREPVAAPGSVRDDRELVASLNALAAALRGLGGGAHATGGAQPLVVPRWVDRGAAFASAGMRAAQVADDELAWDRAMKAWRSKHLFWTAQQVLDVYGKPDEIESGDGQAAWIYRLPVGEDGEEAFSFRFDGGVVYGAEYDF